jgi:thiol-disulfide isomerase/thioredoxin
MRCILLTILTALISSQQASEIHQRTNHVNWQQIEKGTCVDYDFIKESRGKITIIEFWATWCGPCVDAMHHLKVLKQKLGDKLHVVCVSNEPLYKTNAFVSKNNFPFDFIHDKDNTLSKVFPHSGIPHSILIDKYGKVIAETLPGYITEKVLFEVEREEKSDVPQKVHHSDSDLTMPDFNSLVKFELLNYKLGERDQVQSFCKEKHPHRIITGYAGDDSYRDTISTMNGCTITGKNILGLYQYAYDGIPLTHFSYTDDLKYINSHLPNHRYSLNFMCSSLLGDYKSILIGQLNNVFGLKTRVVEKESMEILVLEFINTSEKECSESVSNQGLKASSDHSYKHFHLSATHINAIQIARSIESKFKLPVKTNLPPDRYYDVEITINEEDTDTDVWLRLFKEKGLVLKKVKEPVKYVTIEKLHAE